MKNLISLSFSVVILLKIISICNGGNETEEEKSNFELYGDELPERIKWWKSKEYGLEITGAIRKDKNLVGEDEVTQNRAALVGKPVIEKKIDELIGKHKSMKAPDLTITKMDPMSYEFEGQKMLITFKNIKLTNLDTYDRKTAAYTQNGVYLFGTYDMNEEMYKSIKKKGGKLASRTKMIDGKKKQPNKYYLDRRDVEWTVKLSSKFVTNQPLDWVTEEAEKKPIIIETEFKIQPDPEANKQKAKSNDTPLRAKGVVKIEFYNFEFAVTFLVTHTDDPLREFFPPERRSDNIVPDFKAEYDMESIEVKIDSIKLLEYDGDDTVPEKINRKENVNENLPSTLVQKESFKNNHNSITPTEEEKRYEDNPGQKDLVVKHFEELKRLVLFEKKDIKKRLYLNLLPKMAWKIMKMDTKRQLPYLLREIIMYDDEFQEKTKLSPVPLTDTLYAGMKLASATFNVAYDGMRGFFRRAKSAP